LSAVNRERYVYPDLSVVCGPVIPELGANDVLTNPTLLVEVLSSSTSNTIAASVGGLPAHRVVDDYVLVSQTAPRIEHYRRDRTRTWLTSSRRGRAPRDVQRRRARLDAIFTGCSSCASDE